MGWYLSSASTCSSSGVLKTLRSGASGPRPDGHTSAAAPTKPDALELGRIREREKSGLIKSYRACTDSTITYVAPSRMRPFAVCLFHNLFSLQRQHSLDPLLWEEMKTTLGRTAGRFPVH